MNREKWLNNILEDIGDFASEGFQHEAWLAGGRYISSPNEMYNQLFDDHQFDLYFNSYGSSFTAEERAAWIQLRETVDKYGDTMDNNPRPEDILADPGWALVRSEAANFLRVFERQAAMVSGTAFGGKVSLENARKRLRLAVDPFVELFRTEDCSVELYAPIGEDKQKPHAQDELYVISRGHGKFRRGDEVTPFVTGDVLFVPARMEHRFEEFSDDFETWVIFVGPKR